MIKKVHLIALFTAILSFQHTAQAQTDIVLDIPELPEGVAVLPEPNGTDAQGVTINQYNAPQFKKIIPLEIYTLIRTAGLSVNAVRRLKYEWRLDDEWEKRSADLRARNINIDNNGLLDLAFALEPGFPFGSASGLKTDWDKLSQDGSKNNEAISVENSQFASKLLWNSQALAWRFGVLQNEIVLNWVKDSKGVRSAAGTVTRIYPAVLDSKNKTEQFFREIIRFNSPKSLSSYSWLTFRFRGMDEDSLWVYSPSNKKTRQITGSNRTDSLITSALSAEDLFGWSGKLGLVQAVVSERLVGLVPFLGVDMVKLAATEDGCLRVTTADDSAQSRALPLWNLENRIFPGDAAWAPSAATFIPRTLWKIELTSRDPYSLYGREILYVDASMQLPIYSVIFDRAGKLYKTLINSYGLAVSADRSMKVPYQVFTLVLDHSSNTALLVDYPTVRFCKNYTTDVQLDNFAPGKLGVGAASTPP